MDESIENEREVTLIVREEKKQEGQFFEGSSFGMAVMPDKQMNYLISEEVDNSKDKDN